MDPEILANVCACRKDVLATGVVAALEEIERRERRKTVVLVGHSSDGGLS